MKINSDFLIIGAGIIGLSVAIELKKRFPSKSVVVIEKESGVGQHASTRNSGVLHAGFYYTKDSLKAKLTKIGNEKLKEFCHEHNIPVNNIGKLVVARDESELNRLETLYERGINNNVSVKLITEDQAKEIEPRVKTHHRALWSPSTAVVNPHTVMEKLHEMAINNGIEVITSVPFVKKDHTASYVINTAGLYTDKIASEFGFSKDYKILPFKGLYLYSRNNVKLNTNIYPVPNLANPFLGVHFTVSYNGNVKIGPTAIPCAWREQYGWANKFNVKEFTECSRLLTKLLLSPGWDIKNTIEEFKKYNKNHLINSAGKLINGIDDFGFGYYGSPGIRAQLINTKSNKLEQDFIVEYDSKSLHVLNAVSPSFTCAFSLSEYITDLIQQVI